MTNQEVYDRVKAHQAAQPTIAWFGNRCVYRGKDGKRCAVGCLIPEERYERRFEDVSLSNMRCTDIRDAILSAAGLTLDQLPLAIALQKAHDSEVCWSPAGLANVATRFGLVP